MRGSVVVVDPYSTGALIAPELRRREFATLCVQSSPDLSPGLVRSYRPEDFDERIPFDGDGDALVKRLAGRAVRFVLPGNESAVEMADWLGERLGCRGNGTRLTRARRNKYEMIERLAACGLATARQRVATSAAEAADWAAEVGWPVVAKPLDSASTDHVGICRTPAELSAAVAAILGARNFCGRQNEAALVQSYLDGEEYVVNSISRDGRHYICDVLHSAKRPLNGTPFVYDHYRLLPPDDPRVAPLSDYALRTLDALEIRNGAAHAEIRLTGRGPVLVEIAARCMGPLGSTPAIALGTGHDQTALLVDAFDDGERFQGLAGRAYPFLQHAMVCYLPVLAGGTVARLADAAWVEALPSCRGIAWVPRPGDSVVPTIDLVSVLAKIYLAHPDAAVLEADYRRIRAAEAALQPGLTAADLSLATTKAHSGLA